MQLLPSDQLAAPPTLFILGAPRSGTSWLYKVLCLHPRAAWVSNYVRRVPWFPGLAVVNRLAPSVPRLRANAWFPDGEAYVYGRRRSLVHRLFPAPVEGGPLFARAAGADGAASSMDAAALRRTIRRLITAADGAVFVSKRIAHNRHVPQLQRAFPDARFVHLVRDGRDVAASLLRVDWWLAERLWWLDGSTVAESIDRGADPLELAARHWLAEVTAARENLRTVERSRVQTVRYEDLLAGGLPMIESILRFGGLDPSERWRSDARAVLGGFRRPVTPPDARPPDGVVLDVQGPELDRLGYEL